MKIREIKTLLELKQAVEVGRQAGVVHDNLPEEAPVVQQPEQRVEQKQQRAIQPLRKVEPREAEPIEDEPLPEPAPSPVATGPIAPMTISERQKRDGVVVNIPLPAKK